MRFVKWMRLSISYSLFFVLLITAQVGLAQYKELSNEQMKVSVDPGTFAVTTTDEKGNAYVISAPAVKRVVNNIKQDKTHLSWTSGESLTVFMELHDDYLQVDFKSADTAHLSWPKVETKISAFTIPLHQGKYIPVQDEKWQAHFAKNPFVSGTQDLSMQFFAANFKAKALVYVIRNMFNNELEFYTYQGALALQFKHEFPATVKDKQFGFRIYLVNNDPVVIAKTYKKYVEEQSSILTLAEKARDNDNIRKLYGAPHIYIWNNEYLVNDDIKNWKLLKDKIIEESAVTITENPNNSTNPPRHIFELFQHQNAEAGKAFLAEFSEFKKDGYSSKYHQNLFLSALNEALKSGRLSKEALNSSYPLCFKAIQDWGGAPLAMLDEMQAAGIKNAWLGLNDWEAGEIHPEFVLKAKDKGYLIGPYDSYHSMHPPGKEVWITAKFEDTTLYNRAYVLNKNGKPARAFLGKGRKLSPVLAMPAVKQRISGLMKGPAHEFNSWFIDCDGTGEILDDYTPGRMTSQQQDLEARLQRMAWIRDQYKLVIGTEVGNDYAANTIAFGHGMTTPVIAWSDPDMRKNKKSKYYIGAYYASDGGVPGRYALQVPLKDEYLYIYFDSRFNIPLYQLVYNNSVITSHHWECGSLKIPGEIKNTELKEILYNVPPMYHLNQSEWAKYKGIIGKHVKVFSKTHALAVQHEMTGFNWLTKDRLVQRTVFGKTMEIIANFSNVPFTTQGRIIPAHALLINQLLTGEQELYIPG